MLQQVRFPSNHGVPEADGARAADDGLRVDAELPEGALQLVVLVPKFPGKQEQLR